MTDEVLHPDWIVSSATRDKLGESPVWVAEERALYWVDFYGPIVRRLSEDGEVTSWTLPHVTHVGSIVAARGGLLTATEKGLFVFSTRTGDFNFAGDPNEGRVGIGYNDAKTDRQGRYWVGTFDTAETAPRGILYCIEREGRRHVADSGYVVCNGPAFSPDGLTLYFSDTLGRQVVAYDVAPNSAVLCNRRLFFAVPGGEGMPDGVTVDAGGDVWLAHYGGGLISRLDRTGKRVRRYAVPVSNVTSLCFGGVGLDSLFVTTGESPASADDMAIKAGMLLSFKPGCIGLPDLLH